MSRILVPAALAAAVLAAAAVFGVQLLPRDASTFGEKTRHVTGGSLYPPNDPWKRYLADERTCPNAERTDVPLVEQANTMVCLVNFARAERGLPTLPAKPVLNDSSAKKATRIEACNQFDHDPCGTRGDKDARAAGYAGTFGENIYMATGPLAAPRLALDGWLNSPDHRHNLFDPRWRVQGIAVRQVARLAGQRDVTVWVNEFGDF